MNSTRWKIFVVCFWVFICGMLLWQFFNYNQGLDKQTVESHATGQYFYYDTNTNSAPAKAKVDGPEVKQVSCDIEDGAPTPPYFTCHVTLKNYGSAKAVHVVIWVRPYKGVSVGDGETLLPGQPDAYVNDDDPVAQIGEWVSFPDLGPGETNAQTVSFLKRNDFQPGNNPKPEIHYSAEDAKP
jgi:hypothetical protein